MTDTDADVQQQLHNLAPNNPLLITFLRLCQISYDDPTAIPGEVSDMTPLTPGGKWTCVWGPAQTDDIANLAFVALCTRADGTAVFPVVVIRGTAEVDDIWGLLEQLYEDLSVADPQPPTWNTPAGCLIASGTLDGLDDVRGMTSGTMTLLGYLSSYLSNPANSPTIVVTGHSLGGCLTTVVAPWLKTALAGTRAGLTVVPVTYAAPTAGNAAYAAYYQSLFTGAGGRVFNTLDVAPLGWGALSSVDTIYDRCNVPVPAVVSWSAWGLNEAISWVGYTQPGVPYPLTGKCLEVENVTWYDEGYHQHHTGTYMALLTGKPVTAQLPSPAARARRRPSHDAARAGQRVGSRVKPATPPAW